MQTLGLSDSTPRTEGRLTSLFWPSIESAADVDYLGAQGYWVCISIAVISFAVLAVRHQAIAGGITLLFLYLGGVGVRERSRFAAASVLIFYILDTLFSLRQLLASPGLMVPRTIIAALLFSNLRATWIAAQWKPGSAEAALPPRLGNTWRDKFVDRWPAQLWPRVQVPYYILSIVCLLFLGLVFNLAMLGAFIKASTDTLEQHAHAALMQRNFKKAAQLYHVVTLVSPKRVEAWDNLGSAYEGEHDPDKAIDAYQRALALYPTDLLAWDGLGHAYQQEKQYEQAIAAYQELIKINPLDSHAQSTVGRLFLRTHRYPEAVAQLEAAVSVSQNDTTLLELLGETYLRTGHTDKAMAQFDKALQQSATPHTWNNVAYALADTGQRLDLARQYAELAVSRTEEELRNGRSIPATQRELAFSSSLADYWDTLGWVYFRQGDITKAERYVAAAWLHSDGSEIGCHLGEIYEKQGNRQKAIAMYAAAASVASPHPEAWERLKKLAGATADQLVVDQEKALTDDHTQKLGWSGVKGTGHFLLTLDGSGQVTNARFLNGPEAMTAHEAELANLKFNLTFPDATTEVFLHRAKVNCSEDGGCKLTLMNGNGVMQ